MPRPLVASLVCLVAACSASQAPPGPPAPTSPPASSAPVATTALVASSGSSLPTAPASAPLPAASAPATAAPPPPPVKLGTFRRELAEPVVSLALGEKRAAALGDDAWQHEKGAWRKISIPDKFRFQGEGAEGRIFFGRDDRPRIMGVRVREGQPAQLYLRHRDGQWRESPGEIGKLADAPRQAMWGVLGHLDPEVVCKVDDQCIIKRLTGWKYFKTGKEHPRVELHNGVAWALKPGSIERLEDDKRWVAVGQPAPFGAPGGVWALGDEAWVSEPGAGKLHHWHKGAWSSEASPVAGPRGLWGTRRDDLWLAADGGLAHFDGTRWSPVEGPEGPLAEVYTRGGEVWAGGKSGVWTRPAP